jgi:hypothetical protein
MDYNENKPEVAEEVVTGSPKEASTVRRTITALLVLVAALLLGYVLYDSALDTSSTQVDVNYESDGYMAPKSESQELKAEAALEITTSGEETQEQI